MKKLSAILVGMSLVAGAVMAAGPVTSVNAVGYSKVDLPRDKFVMLACQFEQIDGSTNTITKVLPGPLPDATQVFLFDAASQTYTEEFYDEAIGWLPGTSEMGRQSSVWIKIPASSASATQEVVVAGQVPMTNATVSVVRPGFQLLAYPYPVDLVVTNAGFQGSDADQLFYWNPSTETWKEEFYDEAIGWLPGDTVVKTSQGFFYKSTSSTNKMWVATRPYSLQ
jgi:hypothetical protein